MISKVELKNFLNLKACQDFVNKFCKDKKVLKKNVTPLANVGPKDIIYFVYLEYLT